MVFTGVNIVALNFQFANAASHFTEFITAELRRQHEATMKAEEGHNSIKVYLQKDEPIPHNDNFIF